MSLAVTEKITDGTVIFNPASHPVVFTLLPFSQTPNKEIRVQHVGGSSNTVTVQTDPTGIPRDSFPGGVYSVVLTDSVTNYFTVIKRPGISGVPAIIVAGVGSTGGSNSPVGSITSLTASEDTSTLQQDGDGNVTAAIDETIGVSPTGITVTTWLDKDDGEGTKLQQTSVMPDASNVIAPIEQMPTDPTEVNWTLWAAVGTYTADTPPTGASSYNFTVTAVGTVSPSVVTDAIFLDDPLTGDTMDYPVDAAGVRDWLPYCLQWTWPLTAVAPNLWFIFITVQKGTVTGGMWGPSTDAEGADESPLYNGRMAYSTQGVDISGGAIVDVPGGAMGLIGAYPANDATDRTFRFWLYAVSSMGTSPIGGGTGTIVLENVAWSGGTDHFDLTPEPHPASIDGALLALGSVTAVALNVAAINASTGALNANAVVDGLCSLPVGQLVYGSAIFSGPVYLSQGSAYPVIALLNSGIYLYGVAGPGNLGLASGPYVAVQNTGIGLFSGTGTQSLTLTPTSLTLWYANGDVTQPYFTLQSLAASIVNGNNSLTISSTLARIAASSTIYTSVTSTGVTVVNGNYSLQVQAGQLIIGYSTTALPAINGPAFTVSSLLLTMWSVNGNTSLPYIQMSSSGFGAFSGTGLAVTVGPGGIYLWSKNANASYPYVSLTSTLLELISGSSNVQVGSNGVTITSPTSIIQLGSNSSYPNAAVFTYNSLSTQIQGNDIRTGTIEAFSVQLSSFIVTIFSIPATATAGSDAIPSLSAGFLPITVNGNSYKLALFFP